MDIRRFYITNANNDTMPLQGDSVDWFAANPENLGAKFTQSWYTTGTEFRSYNRSISNQDISFTMYYLGNNPYVSFSTFAKFLSYSPLTLVYQVPGDEAYRRSISLTEIDKGEMDNEHSIMKGKLTFTPTSLWQKWEVAEQIVNNWDDSMSSKYYDDNHVAPTLYKAVYVYGNGSVYDYLYSEDATYETKFYDGLTYLDHYDAYTENLAVQPNLLTGAFGRSNDLNGITVRGPWTGAAGIDTVFYDDFNKHIREYDGQRLVMSLDLDLTFKDVNIPSSVSSIYVYTELNSNNQGTDNKNTRWAVPESKYVVTNVDITKMVKTGSKCTVHLVNEFTMTPKILNFIRCNNIIGMNYPEWVDGIKLTFDSHMYNAKLEVKHNNINPKSNILSQKYTGHSSIGDKAGSLLWPNITHGPLFDTPSGDYGEVHLYGVHGVGSDEYVRAALYNNGKETKLDANKFEKVSDTHYKYSLKPIRTNDKLMADPTSYTLIVYKVKNAIDSPEIAAWGYFGYNQAGVGNWGFDYAFIEAPSVPSTCMVPSYAESQDLTKYPDGFYDVIDAGDNPHTYLSDGSGGVNIGSEYDYIYQEDNHSEHPYVTVQNNSVYTGMTEEDSYAPIRVLFMATNKTGIINSPTFKCQSDNGEEFLTRINVVIPVGWNLEINTSYSGRVARMYERDNPSNKRSVMNSIDITETMFMKVPYGRSTITNLTDSMGRTTDPSTFQVQLLEERVVV